MILVWELKLFLGLQTSLHLVARECSTSLQLLHGKRSLVVSPTGTKFGPITFIGMIDSAASDSRTHTFKYVDDLSLAEVRPANQPSQIEKDVQDLDD